MEILGQFNLGFIIAKHKRDLFIIDQVRKPLKHSYIGIVDNDQGHELSLCNLEPLEAFFVIYIVLFCVFVEMIFP